MATLEAIIEQPEPEFAEDNHSPAGAFITDLSLEELKRADAAREAHPEELLEPLQQGHSRAQTVGTSQVPRSASSATEPRRAASKASGPARRLVKSSSASKLERPPGDAELQGSKLERKSQSFTSLTNIGKTKGAILDLHARASVTKEDEAKNKLKPALFQHKELNYYEGLRVKPGNGWFGALAEKLGESSSRLTRSLLAVLDVSFVETFCFVNYTKMLISNSDCGLTASIGEEAMTEFLQHAQIWNQTCQGCPIVVQKKCHGNPSKGCENRCLPMDLVELQAAVQRLGADDECIVFQRFVGPRVQGCPSLVRVAWRDSLAPRGYRLKCSSSPEQPAGVNKVARDPKDEKIARWTVSSGMPGTQATELRSVPSSAFQIANQIAHFTQTVFGLQLTQLVVDLLQDERGAYFFSQVKAFTAQPQWLRRVRTAGPGPGEDWQGALRGAGGSSSSAASKKSRKKTVVPTAVCSMCTCSQPLSKMNKRMTPKMMLETEHHMRRRGLQLFHVSRVRAIDLSDLTAVCDACWGLYLAETELCRAEARLGKAVGIDMSGEADDEAYVPFGGVLASVRSGNAQADFGGVHKARDPFRIHNPMPVPIQPQLSQNAAQGQGGADGGEWPSMFRRGGEALAFTEPGAAFPEDQAVALPVPQAALQWRMMIHINRLMDIAPELRNLIGSSGDSGRATTKGSGQARLTLRVEVPWQPESPQYIQLQPFGPQDDLSIQRTAVHFIFTDPTSHHPLQAFLSQSLVRCSLLLSTMPSESIPAGRPSGQQEVLTGNLSLERLSDSLSDGFLAQTWVMFCKENKSQCQLKLTLGLVCDHTVSTEYVALRSYADAFVPSRPYFSSDVLPTTWTASILGDKSYIPAQCSGIPASELRGEGQASDSAEASTFVNPSGEPIQRGCPALLGGPLLLAPRPSSALSTQTATVVSTEGAIAVAGRDALVGEATIKPGAMHVSAAAVPAVVAAAMSAAISQDAPVEMATMMATAGAMAAAAILEDAARCTIPVPAIYCSCGNHFVDDAIYCRKCGKSRAETTLPGPVAGASPQP